MFHSRDRGKMAKPSEKSTLAIIEAANEWLVKLRDEHVTPSDETAFDAWLRESPVHVREYLRAESVWVALEAIDAHRSIDLDLLVKDHDDNVTPIGEAAVTARKQTVIASQRPATPLARLATAAAVILTALAAWWFVALPEGEHYATGLGEQRRLVLEDGSVIDMNTQSELTVRLGDEQRHVLLLSGEALFTVAKDPSRPFVVASDLATVSALGTQFNVHRLDDEMRVTVLEGRVSVASLSGRSAVNKGAIADPVAAQSVELSAGDAAELRPGAPIRKSVHVNTERTLAWTERRLIFDNEPLSVVVAEFNRYNPRQLVVEHAALGERRISAVFDADRPETLVRFLAQSGDIDVTEVSSSRVLIKPAALK